MGQVYGPAPQPVSAALALVPGGMLLPVLGPDFTLTLGLIIFALGLLALLTELVHPGAQLPGLVGMVALLAGGALLLLAGSWLPPLLMLLGFSWVVAVAYRGARDRRLLPGLLVFSAGSLLAARAGAGLPVGLLLTLVVGASAFLIVRAAGRARRWPVRTGPEALVGAHGITRQALAPEGFVRLRGELWAARSLDGTLAEGRAVRVVGLDGLTLLVVDDEAGARLDLRLIDEHESGAPLGGRLRPERRTPQKGG